MKPMMSLALIIIRQLENRQLATLLGVADNKSCVAV